jgi:alkylation response protein AidB-like acyl-CoA dehydrogenase
MATTETPADVSVTRTLPELLEVVEQLRPVIEANAPRAEAERRLPAEVFDAMRDGGLFDMQAPRLYGGLELHPVETMRVCEAVARIDSAAAWNLVMNQAVGGFAAWLPEEGARELFGDGPTTVAGAFFPPAAATRVEGGWRITGRVPFASGCDNARWFLMPAVEMHGDQPRVDPATGQPAPFGLFLPRQDARILDTWHTLGMRGTGSADISVTDAFVPDRRVFAVAPLAHPAPGFEGPLYRMFPMPAVLGEATVSVGVAAAAVDDLIHLAKTKTPAYNAVPLREQQLAQHAVGRARARVDAARDTLHRAAEEAYAEAAAGSLLSWDAKTRLQLAVSLAAELCAEAVRLANEVAGSSAIRLEYRFERHFRDCHVLTQHTSKASARYATAGRLLFGLENDWIWLSF